MTLTSYAARCPRCNSPVLALPEFDGQVVGCPTCNGNFVQPVAQGSLVFPPPPSVPQIVVVQAPAAAPRERLPAAGWFTRGFSLTTGILTGIGVVLVAAAVALSLLIYGLASTKSAREAAGDARAKQRSLAALKPYMKPHGIERLSNDIDFLDIGRDEAFVYATGRSLDGSLHKVSARLHFAWFDNVLQVEVTSLTIDGEVCELQPKVKPQPGRASEGSRPDKPVRF
jgi:hypothetical protein